MGKSAVLSTSTRKKKEKKIRLQYGYKTNWLFTTCVLHIHILTSITLQCCYYVVSVERFGFDCMPFIVRARSPCPRSFNTWSQVYDTGKGWDRGDWVLGKLLRLRIRGLLLESASLTVYMLTAVDQLLIFGNVAFWLRRWICNPEVQSSNPFPCYLMDFCLVVPDSTLPARFINSLPPAGIFNTFLFNLIDLFV